MKKRILNLFLLIIFSIISITPSFGADKIEVTNDENGIWVFKINTKKQTSELLIYLYLF